MSIERIYDPTVLNEPAKFTLHMDILEEDYPQNNPDGTRPTVNIDVESTNYSTALQVLLNLHETQFQDYIEVAISESEVIKELSEEDVIAWTDEVDEKVNNYLQETVTPFRTTLLAYETKNANDETALCNIKITAPSYILGRTLGYAITNETNLNAFVANLMPLAHEED